MTDRLPSAKCPSGRFLRIRDHKGLKRLISVTYCRLQRAEEARKLLDDPPETFIFRKFVASAGDGSAQPRNGPMLVLSRKKDESIVINN
ncbi:MAG: carbon storage regulator, partial [Planctomycetota bacterium]